MDDSSDPSLLDTILRLESAGAVVTVFALGRPSRGRFGPGVTRVEGGVFDVPHHGEQSLLDAIRALQRAEPDAMRAACAFADRMPAEARSGALVQAVLLAEASRRRGVDRLHVRFPSSPARIVHLAHLLTGIEYSLAAPAGRLAVSLDGASDAGDDGAVVAMAAVVVEEPAVDLRCPAVDLTAAPTPSVHRGFHLDLGNG